VTDWFVAIGLIDWFVAVELTLDKPIYLSLLDRLIGLLIMDHWTKLRQSNMADVASGPTE